MKTRFLFFMLVAFLPAAFVHAQSNAVIDTLLSQKQALAAETCYLAMVGGGHIDESASAAEAFDLAREKGWIRPDVVANTPMNAEDVAFLVMRAFGLRGGFMYMILPIRRYAYRELVGRGILNGSGGTKRILAGDEAAALIGKASSLKGGD